MSDTYANFNELSKCEQEGIDFRIVTRARKSSTAVAAPHGGSIERGTSEIAEAIAGNKFSLYLFEGLKPKRNSRLHITSTHFDEPRGIALVKSSKLVVTIHGQRSPEKFVFLGGKDTENGNRVRHALQSRGFQVRRHRTLAGRDPANICNLGTSRAGVQIEITIGLRRTFFRSLGPKGRRNRSNRFHEFIEAVQSSIA